MSDCTDRQIVIGLLTAARLEVSAEESAQMIKDYPEMRARADALYLPELEFVESAARFDPMSFYTALSSNTQGSDTARP